MPVNKNTNEWGQLSMKDRADLIAIYTKHGYTSIDDIRKDYESNRDRFINSDANFVQRLRNEDTRSIIDENGENATHKMSWVTGETQATIYPSIQESEGRLVNREKEKLGGYYLAAENGDTVNVSKPFAEYYEPRYKRDFQGFFEKFVPQKKTVADMNEELIYDNRRENSNVLAPGGDLNDGGTVYSGGNLNESKVSAKLSRAQWDRLYKEGKVKITDIPREYQTWIEGNNSKFKSDVVGAINDFGRNYAFPFVASLAAGPAGGLGYLSNLVTDWAISAFSKGEKQTFGDLFFDPQEHPWLNMGANMLNPVNFIPFSGNSATKLANVPKNASEMLYTDITRQFPNASRRFYRWIPEKGKAVLHKYTLSNASKTAKDEIISSINAPKSVSKKTAKLFMDRLQLSENTPGVFMNNKQAIEFADNIKNSLFNAEKGNVLTDFIRRAGSYQSVPTYFGNNESKILYKALQQNGMPKFSMIKHGDNLDVYRFNLDMINAKNGFATRVPVGTVPIPKNLNRNYYSNFLDAVKSELQHTYNLDEFNTSLRILDKDGLINDYFSPNWYRPYNLSGEPNLDMSFAKFKMPKSIVRRMALNYGRELRDNYLKDTLLKVYPESANSDLYKILRESPQYTQRAIELHNIGLSDEDVVKQLLNDRFTFVRGVGVPNLETEHLTQDLARNAITTTPETPIGGRADIEVFGKLLPNEDALYTSNSIGTALGYSYPESDSRSFIGILKRKPESFDWSGTPLNWWRNNRLPDNIKMAPSTAGQTPGIMSMGIGFIHKFPQYKDKSNDILAQYQGLFRSGVLKPEFPSFNHFLMKGEKMQTPLDYLYLDKMINTDNMELPELQEILGIPISDDIVTRQHVGVATPGFSLGNKYGGRINRFDTGGDTDGNILQKAYNWIVGLFSDDKTNEKEQTNIIQDIDNRMLEEFRQKNRNDRFYREKRNDSPTQAESESIEDDINSRERKMFNVATRRRGDFKGYYIPYIEEKEIVVPKVGRVSTNVLDSLAINAERAGIPIKDALGLASVETKFGATPNISTSAWKKLFVEKYKRNPTDEEIKKYERECLNASYARNFGGIYPNFLINNHDWYNLGWEQSSKYKDLIDIKSPLQHGFTIYKKGLYNTGDKRHGLKVRKEGERLFGTNAIKLWYKQYEKDKKEGKINR